MIKRTPAWETSTGAFVRTLEEAQQCEIEVVLKMRFEAGPDITPDQEIDVEFFAKLLVVNKDRVIDILTTTANSKPKARKINGGRKPRAPKTITESETAA